MADGSYDEEVTADSTFADDDVTKDYNTVNDVGADDVLVTIVGTGQVAVDDGVVAHGRVVDHMQDDDVELEHTDGKVKESDAYGQATWDEYDDNDPKIYEVRPYVEMLGPRLQECYCASGMLCDFVRDFVPGQSGPINGRAYEHHEDVPADAEALYW